MRVYLAGATGAIGRRLIPQLLAEGNQVTATTRTRAKADQLGRLGATAVVVDGLDAAATTRAVAAAHPDVVVHQMTALSDKSDLRRFDRWFARTNELRTTGTDILVDAARQAGVTRVVAQSYTGWTNPRTGGAVKSEGDGLDPHPLKMQQQSLAAIRYLEESVPVSVAEGIVLRYGNLYGPGALRPSIELIRKRRLPIIGEGTGVWSWVHVDDAASATVAALERGGGGVYNIVDDDPAAVSQWLPYLADVVGGKPPIHVPAWLARIAAGSVTVQWMTEGRGASNDKANRELNWRPAWSTWRDGFRDGLGQ
jgi:2-alkyl-3-oxoalkanoate reductase